METREFRVLVLTHSKTGMLMAVSPDHKGLNVAARSEEELKTLLPQAIRALLEAEGEKVIAVETRHELDAPPGFDNPSYRAEARLAA